MRPSPSTKATMQRVLRAVLQRITPPGLPPGVKRFLNELNERLARAGLPARATLGGSTAKGTFLKDSHDVDIFVRFDPARAPPDLSDALVRVLPEARRVHGSRDYFQLERDGLLFEIVPVLAVRNAAAAENVTDMSPLHVDYVVRRLRRTPLADDIRLAKQFCKAAGVYGAESHIKGVSGHVLDLLVLFYGGFLPFLRAVASWPDQVVLDPARHHADPLRAIAADKRGPLVLVDPLQPTRNAAAALSREQFDRLRRAARRFLARPTEAAFRRRRVTPALLRARFARAGHVVAVIEYLPLPGKEDVAATKLLKAHEFIVAQVRRAGFRIVRHGWEYEPRDARGLGWLVVPAQALPRLYEWPGPPVTARRDAERFRRKHAVVFERDGRLFARLRRRHRVVRPLLRELLAAAPVRSRTRRARLVVFSTGSRASLQ